MANKYANLVGSNKIKDEYPKINTGFEKVEADVTVVNGRIDNIITTPIEGAAATQEVVDARGTELSLGARLNGFSSQLAETENQLDNTNSRIDNIISTPTEVSEQEIIDSRYDAGDDILYDSLGARLNQYKQEYNELNMRFNDFFSMTTDEDEIWEVAE